jgi:5'-AMP-activated protein kinase regulatory beta subunit
MAGTKKSKEKNIRFSYKGEPGKKVYLAGTFNDWDPRELEMIDAGSGDYSIALKIPAGSYEYKFIVNDDWVLDDDNEVTVCNGCGSLNNVIIIE